MFRLSLPRHTEALAATSVRNTMTTTNDTTTDPAFRFKRRKVAHAKRAPLQHEPTTPVLESPQDVSSPIHATPPLQTPGEDDESTLNLREILRNRKRPRDRVREAARKSETNQTRELVIVDAPKQDSYASRFIAQTGQVVDKDDQQMYVVPFTLVQSFPPCAVELLCMDRWLMYQDGIYRSPPG
jgi:hypothetical protein